MCEGVGEAQVRDVPQPASVIEILHTHIFFLNYLTQIDVMEKGATREILGAINSYMI